MIDQMYFCLHDYGTQFDDCMVSLRKWRVDFVIQFFIDTIVPQLLNLNQIAF